MADIIQLLPDAIANQIAAGEVIQRPASVVKELMENSIDAGSTEIRLIIKEAGKALIQVADNGCGMSETDARMSLERHATSKIRTAQDLFSIRTMGFRGEAMASICAIAHLELKTRRKNDEVGVKIVVEGSEVKQQEVCQTQAGTVISVKNLFFNVPARRNFLKSNPVEMRHIIDEFQRIALANPDVFFSLHHNGNELFHLKPGNLRQRIIGIFGPNYNKRLVPISEETDVLSITGFIGKPEFAKKSRGDQFFFVNDRFIKSGYLHHAIMTAYEDILNKDTYPLYVILFDVDPELIDINVHPTKQEIKFDNERLVYNYLKVAVRHALGKHNITPSLDFDQNTNFASPTPGVDTPPSFLTDADSPSPITSIPSAPSDDFATSTPSFTSTPSSGNRSSGSNSGSSGSFFDDFQQRPKNNQDWEKLYQGFDDLLPDDEETQEEPVTLGSNINEEETTNSFTSPSKKPYQIHASYIVSQIKSGFLLIDQQAAHERILYEQYLEVLDNSPITSQQQLFPMSITLPVVDVEILRSLLPELNKLGFDLEETSPNTFAVKGIPSEISGKKNEKEAIEELIEQYKNNLELNVGIQENIAHSMARSTAIKKGQRLEVEQMQELIDQLFACASPFKSPNGRKCFLTFELDELVKRFDSH